MDFGQNLISKMEIRMSNKYEIIAKTKTEYTISIWDHIESYSDYDKVFEELGKIKEEDKVILKVSSPGGRCDVGFNLFDRIKGLECRVDVIVPYPTYSMGAILALSGHSLTVNPGAFLMFHDYSTGTKGKGNEIFKQTAAYKEVFEYTFNRICQPFLTKKECEQILNGQDLYVKWNDEDLEKRIRRHF